MADVKVLTGNLTRDVERRQAGSKEILSGGIAVKGQDGETVFMDLVLWIDEKTAPSKVAFMESLVKGTPVAVKGVVKSRQWTKKTGETVDSLSLNVWDIYAGVKSDRRAPVAAPAQEAAPAAAPAPAVEADAFRSAF